MVASVHGIFVHGVGSKTPGNFADKAKKWLTSALKAKGVDFYGRSVLWGPLLDAHQESMARAVAKEGSDNRPFQRVGMAVAGDALSYEYSQDAINHVFDYEVSRLRADDFVIFAHSLGCVLATDWLRSRKRARCSKLVTMGCNLEAFNQNNQAAWAASCPWQVNHAGTWTNVFGPRDALGWPVKHWLPWVEDREYRVGSWLTRWNGASHGAYWTDARLWGDVMPGVILGA